MLENWADKVLRFLLSDNGDAASGMSFFIDGLGNGSQLAELQTEGEKLGAQTNRMVVSISRGLAGSAEEAKKARSKIFGLP